MSSSYGQTIDFRGENSNKRRYNLEKEEDDVLLREYEFYCLSWVLSFVIAFGLFRSTP